MYKYLKFLLVALSFISCKRLKNSIQQSSASENVIVLEKEFEIPALNRTRKIRICLPKDYHQSKNNYPVLYMHDGQSLFDNSTAGGEEWNVDETLNELSISSNLNLIVVGIDNGPRRMHEYSPWENQKYGKAEGKEYMEFIVNEIKPFIDKNYRTFPNRKNTAIMGSSMGGLISHYAIYNYPNIFSKAGILSPSYWYSDKIFEFTMNNPIPKDSKLFLAGGKNEPANVKTNNQKIYDIILRTGHPIENINLVFDINGGHNVSSWKKQFKPAIKWLFAK